MKTKKQIEEALRLHEAVMSQIGELSKTTPRGKETFQNVLGVIACLEWVLEVIHPDGKENPIEFSVRRLREVIGTDPNIEDLLD